MGRPLSLFLFLPVLLTLPADGAAQVRRLEAQPPARVALQRNLEARTEALERAFARGNMTIVAGYYADDAQMIPPSGHRPVTGRREILEYWRRIEDPVSWDLETLDFGGTTDEAWQLVRSTMREGRNAKPHVVRCLLIWRRQPDGSHRIHLDIWTNGEKT